MKLTRTGLVLAAGFRHWLDTRRPTQVVREDLSDALILADLRNTPPKKGSKLADMLFSWPLEKLGPRKIE